MKPGAVFDLRVSVAGAGPGARLKSAGGIGAIDMPVAPDGVMLLEGLQLRGDATWLRLEVIGPDGARRLIGNPIYIRLTPKGA